jgi:hypothetical protein
LEHARFRFLADAELVINASQSFAASGTGS